MQLNIWNNKKTNQYFWLIFVSYLITALIWLYAFEIKKSPDIEDVIMEGMYLFAALICLFYIKRLNLFVMNSGWGLFTWGLVIDFLDEFTKEPEFFDTILEGVVIIMGLLIIAYGFYIYYFQQKRTEKKLAYLANHDNITGAYNRHYLARMMPQEIDRSIRYGHTIGLMMIDIDHFKEINDRFGHQQGDRVLKKTALFLKNKMRIVDKVIRYGGDEFLIVLPESREELRSIKNRLIRQLKKKNIDEGITDIPLSLSIGTALWKPDKTENFEDVINLADRRMYQEKEKKLINKEKK